jgi:glycosyltransferase involved in cell wall biosynthesis
MKAMDGIQTECFKTFDLFNKTYPLFGLDFVKAVYKALKENPEAKVIIHARHVLSSLIASIICKILGRNYILVEHTSDTSFMSSRIAQFLVRVYERVFAKFVIRNASRIISVSDASRDFLVKEFAAQEEKIEIINNGYEPKDLAAIDYSKKKNSVVFAAKWIKVKDPVTTFKAFRKLSEKYPDWEFLMIGSGPEEIPLNDSPKNLKVINKKFKQKDFFKLLAQTKIYINSSLSEGFPLGVIEAAAHGNTLVLSDAPTNRKIAIELKQTDYLFTRSSVSGLVRAIEGAIKNSNIAAQKELAKLTEKYSNENLLPKYIDALYPKAEYSKLSIVIPMYNEERTIKQLLNRVTRANVNGLKKEVIIVDDGSKDSSVKRVIEFITKNSHAAQLRLIKNRKNIGKSQSVKKGILNTTGDLVVIQDADLEYNPKDLKKLVEEFNENRDVRVVYGNRFNSQNKIIYPHFYLGNKFVTMFSNLFTIFRGIYVKDMEVCYKMFEGNLARELAGRIESRTNFGFEPEITARMSQVIMEENFKNVNIQYNPRTVEEGKKIRVLDGLKAVREILKFNINPLTVFSNFQFHRSINYLKSLITGFF